MWCFEVVVVVAFDDVEMFNNEVLVELDDGDFVIVVGIKVEMDFVGEVVEDDVIETVVLVVGQGVGRK